MAFRESEAAFGSWSSSHTDWARPASFAYIGSCFLAGTGHFIWQHRKAGFRAYAGSGAVRRASASSIWQVGPGTLLAFRMSVFVISFYTLLQSTFYEGPPCLRFFTVWNFIALVIFFALGTALSCSCCREIALVRATPSRSHRIAAAAHHLLLEVQLPMAAMITLVVWLVLYPYDAEHDPSLYWYSRYTNLTSLTMHGMNLVFMLLEFGLDALHLEPGHFGLVLGWGMLYALFNGLQVRGCTRVRGPRPCHGGVQHAHGAWPHVPSCVARPRLGCRRTGLMTPCTSSWTSR